MDCKNSQNQHHFVDSTDISIIKSNMDKIREFAQSHLENDDLHGLGHINRVIENLKRICNEYKMESAVLESLGWLHDIGRKYEQSRGRNHAEISAELAIPFLKTLGISDPSLKNMEHAILAHSFSLNIMPQTLEAKILRDADRLDAIGAVGIFRVCTYTFQRNQPLSEIILHIDEKLLKLKDTLETEPGRAIAQKRHQIIAEYKEWLIEELTSTETKELKEEKCFLK